MSSWPWSWQGTATLVESSQRKMEFKSRVLCSVHVGSCGNWSSRSLGITVGKHLAFAQMPAVPFPLEFCLFLWESRYRLSRSPGQTVFLCVVADNLFTTKSSKGRAPCLLCTFWGRQVSHLLIYRSHWGGQRMFGSSMSISLFSAERT